MAKVVMIEDDVTLCEGWTELFSLLGYESTCFSRGAAALADRHAIETCDIAISDYYLPDINGVELLKQMRAINPKSPFILLTGSRDFGIAEALSEIQNCSLIQKPVNIDEIEKRVMAAVNRG